MKNENLFKIHQERLDFKESVIMKTLMVIHVIQNSWKIIIFNMCSWNVLYVIIYGVLLWRTKTNKTSDINLIKCLVQVTFYRKYRRQENVKWQINCLRRSVDLNRPKSLLTNYNVWTLFGSYFKQIYFAIYEKIINLST
jgi:hypothetical protein